MRTIVLVLSLLIFVSAVCADSIAETEVNAVVSNADAGNVSNQQEAEKTESLEDLITWPLAIAMLVVMMGIFSCIDYLRKIPLKFILVDKLEFLASLFLAGILTPLIFALIRIKEPTFLLYILLAIVFMFFYSCFGAYVNLPRFGYEHPSMMYWAKKRERSKQKGAET